MNNRRTGEPRNLVHFEKDYDNGQPFCVHRERDNCRYCEHNIAPQLFDGGCTLYTKTYKGGYKLGMVSEFLFIGKEYARTARDLAHQLHTDTRNITQQVERERRQGIPICATSDPERPGYYLAADDDDLQQYCDKLRKRAGEIFKTRRALLTGAAKRNGTAPQEAQRNDESDETSATA